MNVDRATNEELLSTGDFEVMSLEADEDEHSIEMHLPYLAKVIGYIRVLVILEGVAIIEGICISCVC